MRIGGMRQVGMVVLLSLLVGGCATLFRGDKQAIKVVTDPAGATLTVNGKVYTTPATIVLKRNKQHVITLVKDGYQGFKFNLRANWDAGGGGAVAADAIIPGGSILFIIDTAVGADRQFDEMATIKMPAATQPSPPLIEVIEHKGKLMTKAEYAEAVKYEGLFAKKKPATQPTGVAVGGALRLSNEAVTR